MDCTIIPPGLHAKVRNLQYERSVGSTSVLETCFDAPVTLDATSSETTTSSSDINSTHSQALRSSGGETNKHAYIPNQRSLPAVSTGPSQIFPTHTPARIVGIETDSETNHETYKVVKAVGAYVVGQQHLNVSPKDIAKFVSASELERFEYELAQQRAEQEEVDRRARIAQLVYRKRAGRPRQALRNQSPTSSAKNEESAVARQSSSLPNEHGSTLTVGEVPGAKQSSLLSKTVRRPHNRETLMPNMLRRDQNRLGSSSSSRGSAKDVQGKTIADIPTSHPETSSEEEIYEVEKIIDDKMVDGERVYIVKWSGYDEFTEEPSENLETAQVLVGEYWAMKVKRSSYQDAELAMSD